MSDAASGESTPRLIAAYSTTKKKGKNHVKESSACGSWTSPIGSADLVRGALRLSAPRLEGGSLYWLEGRPSEGGRQVVMVAELGDAGAFSAGAPAVSRLREASPPTVNVRTRVHEYGGGEYTTWRDRLFYVDDRDGRIYGGRIAGASHPLVPEGSNFADLVVSPDGSWLIAVEERPRSGTEPENRLIAVRLQDSRGDAGIEAAGPPQVIAAGHDFYASPIVSSQSDSVAWLAWDHPHMPWNETVLERVAWSATGPGGEGREIAGGRGESLFQPRFSRSGALFVVSDRSGWWNLLRVGEAGTIPVHQDDFEIGRPQWVFGQSTWAFVESASDATSSVGEAGAVLASATVDGSDVLVEIEIENGNSRRLATEFCSVGGLQVDSGWAACIAGASTSASTLVVWPTASGPGAGQKVRESAPLEIDPALISLGEPRVIQSAGGRRTHAFVYAPRSQKHRARPGERPPLLVKSHGGPTSATSAALDPRIQFWTSRGFAVADVNYGGSTGYGRGYRDQLEKRWGVVDVEDCVAVARNLAEAGEVDGDRLAISGGSAGGYTTLCALTFHDTFSAGASHYGIGDLETLARDTHKFESRYTDWLVGCLPEDQARYVERSPVHHPDRLGCPMIFFQGLEDKVVPPNQAEDMVAVLAERGIAHAYVPFEGEQHGFRRAENIRTALDGELYFYSQIFNFRAPHPPGVEVRGGRS